MGQRMEGAVSSQALAVPGHIGAGDALGQVHGHAQSLPHQRHGGGDGQEGIALAAPGAARLSDGLEAGGGHAVAQAVVLPREGGGAGDQAGEDAHAHRRAAAAPEAAGSPGDFRAALLQGPEHLFQIDSPSGVGVGGEERRPRQGVVLGAVHVDGGQGHQFQGDGHRVPGGELQAAQADGHPAGRAVAGVADKVAALAGGVGRKRLAAVGAGHGPLLGKVDQRRAADQTGIGLTGHTFSLLLLAVL